MVSFRRAAIPPPPYNDAQTLPIRLCHAFINEGERQAQYQRHERKQHWQWPTSDSGISCTDVGRRARIPLKIFAITGVACYYQHDHGLSSTTHADYRGKAEKSLTGWVRITNGLGGSYRAQSRSQEP